MTTEMTQQLKKIRRSLTTARTEAKKLHAKKRDGVFLVMTINKAIVTLNAFENNIDACPRCGSREEICPC